MCIICGAYDQLEVVQCKVYSPLSTLIVLLEDMALCGRMNHEASCLILILLLLNSSPSYFQFPKFYFYVVFISVSISTSFLAKICT